MRNQQLGSYFGSFIDNHSIAWNVTFKYWDFSTDPYLC